MREFIIDTGDMAPELQGGLLGVEGSSNPTAAEKKECVETVSQYVVDGWAIAADPLAPMGWLAALTAETACVPFVNLTRLAAEPRPPREPAHASAASSTGLCLETGSNENRICASKPALEHNVKV